MADWADERGFTLIELMVAVIILGIVLIPLLNFFVNSGRITDSAGEESIALNIAQSKMEEYLAKEIAIDALPPQEGPETFPTEENYEYSVKVSLYDASMHLVQVEVEAYNGQNPAAKVRLVSLKWVQ